jgi:LemA protein
MLVAQESNMMASYSNMYVVLQRRNDIGRNLITAIRYYTEYEERVYNEIVRLRSNQPKSAETKESTPDIPSPKTTPEEKAAALAALTSSLSAAAGTASPLTKLMAVAEQYPDLKSETNFSLLMAAMVDLEKDLAIQRIKFNADANTYTTTLRQFPSNIFAWEFGFKNFPYFAATQDAKEFKFHDQKY